MNSAKIKNICSSKDITEKLTGKTQTGRRSAIHKSDKGLTSTIYKQFLQLNNKRQMYSFNNGQKTRHSAK